MTGKSVTKSYHLNNSLTGRKKTIKVVVEPDSPSRVCEVEVSDDPSSSQDSPMSKNNHHDDDNDDDTLVIGNRNTSTPNYRVSPGRSIQFHDRHEDQIVSLSCDTTEGKTTPGSEEEEEEEADSIVIIVMNDPNKDEDTTTQT